jgi:hypothetical protein
MQVFPSPAKAKYPLGAPRGAPFFATKNRETVRSCFSILGKWDVNIFIDIGDIYKPN